MTLKEEILSKYFKPFTREEGIAFVRKTILDYYELQSKCNTNEWIGFVVKVENVLSPSVQSTNAIDKVYEIILPKMSDDMQSDRYFFGEWLKSQGFVWTESNHQCGYRIKI